MYKSKIQKLLNKSQWLRKEIFEMVIKVNQGHIASAFSQNEILVSLFYANILRYKKKKPNYENRQKLIISKVYSKKRLYSIITKNDNF